MPEPPFRFPFVWCSVVVLTLVIFVLFCWCFWCRTASDRGLASLGRWHCSILDRLHTLRPMCVCVVCSVLMWSGISSDSRRTRWRICGPPSFLAEFGGSPTYNRDTLFELDISRYARRLSGSDLFRPAASGPIRARVAWDHDRDRLVLLGGPALRFYRDVRRALLAHLSVDLFLSCFMKRVCLCCSSWSCFLCWSRFWLCFMRRCCLSESILGRGIYFFVVSPGGTSSVEVLGMRGIRGRCRTT